MTPSQQAKRLGLKSLTQVSHITGVSLNTLSNWHKDKPELFETVLFGCLAREEDRIQSEIIVYNCINKHTV